MDYTNIKVDYAAIGAEIKFRMDAKGISVKDMAKAIGVSYQTVHGYINGTRRPTVPHFVAVAQILGSTVDELLVTNYSYIEKIP